MIQCAALLMLCAADRVRGHSGLAPKQLKRVIEALLITLSAGISDIAIAPTTALVWAGICLGSYGNAIGPALMGVYPTHSKTINNPGPEWWQCGILLRSSWLSLIAVGLIWGAPAMLSYPLDHRVAVIPAAFIIAFPSSTWIARIISDHSSGKTGEWAWGVQQWCFGPIMAASLYLLSRIV